MGLSEVRGCISLGGWGGSQGPPQYTDPTGAPETKTRLDSALWPGLMQIVSREARFREEGRGTL